MNPQYPITDETLSAFLDGELAEDERKKVEVWLESSPDARQQLDDLKQIGSLVRSIPIPALPKDFHSAVMQRVQEASETTGSRPVNAATPTANGSDLVAGRARPAQTVKRLLSGLVSLTAVMGLILAVGLLMQTQQRDDVAQHHGEIERAHPVSMEADDAAESALRNSPDADFAPDNGFGSAPAPGMAVPRVGMGGDLPGNMEPSPPEPLPEMADPAVAVAEAVDVFPPNGLTLEEWLRTRPDPSNPPSPGEIIYFLNQIGGQAVLVEFVCVDVKAVDNTRNQLQILLAANGIHPVSEYGVEIDPDSIHFEEGDQVVIYVEADETTIATALNQMDEFNDVLNMNINNLVQYDVADGNVRDPAYEGFNRMGQGYGVPMNPELTSPAPSAGNNTDETPTEGADSAPAPAGTPNTPSRDIVEEQSTDTIPSTRALNNFYIPQNVPQVVVDGLEQQTILGNTVENSRSRMGAQQIADNFDRAQQPTEAEGTEESTDSPLPVQLIFVVRQLTE